MQNSQARWFEILILIINVNNCYWIIVAAPNECTYVQIYVGRYLIISMMITVII